MPKTLTPFLIIFEGRNGSSQLVSLLNTHAEVFCYPEIVVGLTEEKQADCAALVASCRDVRDLNVYAGDDNYFPDGFAAKWDARPFRTVGFKSKVTDFVNPNGMRAELERLNYRLIYLRRDNPLKATISLLNGRRLADKNEQWNARVPAEIQGPLEVDLDVFDDVLKHRRAVEAEHQTFFNAYAGQKLTVCYEDMLANQYGFMSRIFKFLNFPSAQSTLVGGFLKNTPDSMRAAVVNYDDLFNAYRNTEFARYLE